jgi:hypothetical protein
VYMVLNEPSVLSRAPISLQFCHVLQSDVILLHH